MTADLPGLGDQLQSREFLYQLPGDLGSLPDQHNDVCILQPHRKLAQPFDGVGVDLGCVGV